MKIGTLDRRIRIEQRGTVDGDYGPQPGAWTTFATVWANVQDVLPSKAESQADGIRIANRPARIRIRYLSGLTSDMRVLVLGASDAVLRTMKIVSGPAELGRREGMEIMAEEFSTTGEAT